MQQFSFRAYSLADPFYVNAKLFSSAKNTPSKTSQQASFGRKFLQNFLKVSHFVIQLQINSFHKLCYQSNLLFKTERHDLGLSIPSNLNSTASIREIIRPKTIGVLPDSIQDLFLELRARRQRVMELLAIVDEMKSENEKLSLDYALAEKEKAVAVKSSEKIKGSFQSVDQKFIDLRDEVINLREVDSKYRDLFRKHDELRINYEKALTNGPIQGGNEEKKLKLLLETSNMEVQRLEKRIERLRNQSPTMVALQQVFSSITKFSNRNTFGHDALNEEFAALQRKYAKVLTENFPSHAELIGAKEVLVKGCVEYVRSSFPYGAFDCEISSSSGIDKQLSKYLNEQREHGFFIRRISNTSIEVSCPEKNDCIGPYGVLACFIQAFPDRASNMHVFPTIAKITIEKRSKVSIIYDTCKSSKPGGQAANVTETQVKSALTFNGQVIARGHSQDTRSQYENKKRAEQRVIEESLESEIRKWKASPPPLKKIDLRTTDMSTIRCLFQPSNFRTDLFLFGVLQQS